MRTNRTNNVNNNASNGKSTTPSCTRKSAAETYGISTATAFRTIMDAVNAGKENESRLRITKTPRRGKVLITCVGVYNPAVTNAIRKEVNVIAGDECWVETDRCYRAWDKGKQRYEVSRDAWDAAEAAAEKAVSKSEEVSSSASDNRKPKQPKNETKTETAAPTFTLEQVISIARSLRKGIKEQTIKDAITEITGVKFEVEETAEQKRQRELREQIARLTAELEATEKKQTNATETSSRRKRNNGKRKAAK